MATIEPGQDYTGGAYRPTAPAEPRPEIPKERRSTWLMAIAALLALLLVIGVVVGFWRAASAPMPVIETPDVRTPPPGDVQPRPR